MSLYDDILESGLSTLKNSLTDYPSTPVIKANKAEREPTTSYATVSLLSFEQVGKTTRGTHLNSSNSLWYEAPYEVTFQFNFLGKEAPSICLSSHMRMANSVLNREHSQASNMSIIRKSEIRRIPQKRDTKYTEMLTYDVTFFSIYGFTETVGSLEQVVIGDTINDVEISIPTELTP